MANEDKRIEAKVMFDLICRTLDKHEWKYTRKDEDLVITCGARGDDLPVDILFMINPEQLCFSIFSLLPFKVKEDKRVEASLAVNLANYGIINGSFDYDISDGEIRFRLVQAFAQSLLSEDLIYNLLMRVVYTVDHYNDKFLCISTGVMSLEDFIKFEQKKD